MVSTPRLAHVVLQTAQPDVLTDWYCRLLDGHVVYSGKGLTFITFDDEHHRIALLTLPGPEQVRPPSAPGMHHVAFTFDDLDGLLERYQSLAQQGIRPVAPVQHGVTTSLYYRDPDGNYAEMQIDNFPIPDEATAYMEGPEYDADPVGPAFDVDLMVAARAQGAPVAELIRRAWALSGPRLPHPWELFAAAETA
ncbi:VOC family protein [Amycolatopsis pithecellobii]|uniref:Biphenyl 2,3-dioxygenase n=1 Tax=Amycolatopsis pithecellobii TaxID=664692 RepID=A0A6N7ZD46_9PSEU|nr:VOC family protein [Amycolatopsis pithecellobii]MTD59557.1 biphenyl 2,3-dioxygenase [Amycolatopsis pithecellobii]